MNLLGKRKSGPTTASSVEVRGKIIRELPRGFRFEEENEYEIQLKVFACSKKKKKKRHPEKLRFTFFWPKKLIRLFILKEVKLSPDSKMRKPLTFAPTTRADKYPPCLRHSS